MSTRSKVFATVAVLWIAVLGIISLQMLSTDETKPAPTAKIVARCDSAFDPEQCEKVLSDAVPDYDAAGAAVKAAAASLIALVIVGATIIWARPKDDEQVAPSTPAARWLEACVWPDPAARAPRATPAPATIEASLRRLKALHDEGILTDDEYETKRKALADQL